jgi:light-regulated signal transduction histidine kinase (bacteriophytochrome)
VESITAAPITAKNVDLSNCDREQIQFPGAILPHGVMLVLREPELTILQASRNAEVEFGLELNALLNHTLDTLLDKTSLESLRDKSQRDPLQGAPTRVAVVEINAKNWNVLAHRNDQVLFLEFEPASDNREPTVADLYSELRGAIAKLQNARSSQEFLDLAVHRIRAFTGFDRVMAYKFLHDGSGWVRSESVIEGQTSYLGQHFPPSDVPAPAKRIFSLSWLRHQPDIKYIPVPLVPENNPITGGPLDMSYAVLRSVSVMYTGYLKNMGTDASMVMTLLKNGQLWGLIACHHHNGPKHVPYEVRTACEFLANMVSLLIAEKEDLEFADYKLKLKATQASLVEAMSKDGEFAAVLIGGNPNLLDFVRANGAAVVTDGQISLSGKTPTEEQVRLLVEWLPSNISEEVYASDSLASVFPESEMFRDVASGILAIRFAVTKKDYLLWFRPEVIQTVKWAGDPHKPVDYSDDGQRLLPRTSFALWIESVKLKSEPWLDIEIQAAHELRIAILELVLRQAEQLGELYRTLERSYIELDSFAYVASHDLKEPLRGIHNYSRFLLEDCADQLRPEDVDKLRAMARLTQRMEDLLDSLLHYSRVSRNELKSQKQDLNEIVADVLDFLSARISESGATIRIPRPLPSVSLDASLMGEVFSNLISNALKYNDKADKWVEIGFDDSAESSPVFYVRDNGIGIEPDHFDSIFKIFRRLHGPKEFGGGTGAGLTIARRIVERHGGRMWLESTPGDGSTFYFSLAGNHQINEG